MKKVDEDLEDVIFVREENVEKSSMSVKEAGKILLSPAKKAQAEKLLRKVMARKKKQTERDKVSVGGPDLNETEDFQAGPKFMQKKSRLKLKSSSSVSSRKGLRDAASNDTDSQDASDSDSNSSRSRGTLPDKKNAIKHEALTKVKDKEIVPDMETCESLAKDTRISLRDCTNKLSSSDNSSCPLCGLTTDPDRLKIHRSECLLSNFSRDSDNSNFGSDFSESVKCQICHKDITHLNIQRRTQHMNLCIDKNETEMQNDEAFQQQLQAARAILLPCPMCNKNFKTQMGRQYHLKKCAAANKMTVEQVKNLVKQQEEEHNAKLDAGILPEEFLSTNLRTLQSGKSKMRQPKNQLDEDTQFAMALSTSMAEEQRDAEVNAISRVSNRGQPALSVETAGAQGKGQGRGKKGKQPETESLLMTLSRDEAMARISHRVERYIFSPMQEISEPCTPSFKQRDKSPSSASTKISSVLSESSPVLWQKTSLTEAVSSSTSLPEPPRPISSSSSLVSEGSSKDLQFYVKELMPPVAVSQIVPGSKIKRVSAIPGRRRSGESLQPAENEDENIEDHQGDTVSPMVSQTVQILTELAMENDHETSDREKTRVSQSVVHVIQGDSQTQNMDNNSDSDNMESSGFYKESPLESAGEDPQDVAKAYVSVVNSPHFSDVSIVTDKGTEVNAHKIILHTRCPALLAMSSVVDGKEIIDLSEFGEESVTCLLRYVYAGHISLLPPCALEVKQLANRLSIPHLALAAETLHDSSNNGHSEDDLANESSGNENAATTTYVSDNGGGCGENKDGDDDDDGGDRRETSFDEDDWMNVFKTQRANMKVKCAKDTEGASHTTPSLPENAATSHISQNSTETTGDMGTESVVYHVGTKTGQNFVASGKLNMNMASKGGEVSVTDSRNKNQTHHNETSHEDTEHASLQIREADVVSDRSNLDHSPEKINESICIIQENNSLVSLSDSLQLMEDIAERRNEAIMVGDVPLCEEQEQSKDEGMCVTSNEDCASGSQVLTTDRIDVRGECSRTETMDVHYIKEEPSSPSAEMSGICAKDLSVTEAADYYETKYDNSDAEDKKPIFAWCKDWLDIMGERGQETSVLCPAIKEKPRENVTCGISEGHRESSAPQEQLTELNDTGKISNNSQLGRRIPADNLALHATPVSNNTNKDSEAFLPLMSTAFASSSNLSLPVSCSTPQIHPPDLGTVKTSPSQPVENGTAKGKVPRQRKRTRALSKKRFKEAVKRIGCGSTPERGEISLTDEEVRGIQIKIENDMHLDLNDNCYIPYILDQFDEGGDVIVTAEHIQPSIMKPKRQRTVKKTSVTKNISLENDADSKLAIMSLPGLLQNAAGNEHAAKSCEILQPNHPANQPLNRSTFISPKFNHLCVSQSPCQTLQGSVWVQQRNKSSGEQHGANNPVPPAVSLDKQLNHLSQTTTELGKPLPTATGNITACNSLSSAPIKTENSTSSSLRNSFSDGTTVRFSPSEHVRNYQCENSFVNTALENMEKSPSINKESITRFVTSHISSVESDSESPMSSTSILKDVPISYASPEKGDNSLVTIKDSVNGRTPAMKESYVSENELFSDDQDISPIMNRPISQVNIQSTASPSNASWLLSTQPITFGRSVARITGTERSSVSSVRRNIFHTLNSDSAGSQLGQMPSSATMSCGNQGNISSQKTDTSPHSLASHLTQARSSSFKGADTNQNVTSSHLSERVSKPGEASRKSTASISYLLQQALDKTTDSAYHQSVKRKAEQAQIPDFDSRLLNTETQPKKSKLNPVYFFRPVSPSNPCNQLHDLPSPAEHDHQLSDRHSSASSFSNPSPRTNNVNRIPGKTVRGLAKKGSPFLKALECRQSQSQSLSKSSTDPRESAASFSKSIPKEWEKVSSSQACVSARPSSGHHTISPVFVAKRNLSSQFHGCQNTGHQVSATQGVLSSPHAGTTSHRLPSCSSLNTETNTSGLTADASAGQQAEQQKMPQEDESPLPLRQRLGLVQPFHTQATQQEKRKDENNVDKIVDLAASQKQGMTTTRNPAVRQDQGMTKTGNPTARQEQGMTKTGNPAVRQEQGMTKTGNPTVRQEQGMTKTGNPAVRQKQGMTKTGNPAVRQKQGMTKTGNPVAKSAPSNGDRSESTCIATDSDAELFDDGDDSVLISAEEGIERDIQDKHEVFAAKTPVHPAVNKLKKKKAWRPPSPFTPMAPYDDMDTPQLKTAVAKFGVRPVGKKRMRELLKHVYHQTHQYETDSDYDGTPVKYMRAEPQLMNPPQGSKKSKHSGANAVTQSKVAAAKAKTKKQSKASANKGGKQISSSCSENTGKPPGPSTSAASLKDSMSEGSEYDREDGDNDLPGSQDSSYSDGVDVPEESILQGWPEDEVMLTQMTQSRAEVTTDRLLQFISDNQDIYHKILMYEPLELDVLKKQVADAGIRIGMDKIMDFLDERCITFTMKNMTKNNNNRHRRAGQKKSGKSPRKGFQARGTSQSSTQPLS